MILALSHLPPLNGNKKQKNYKMIIASKYISGIIFTLFCFTAIAQPKNAVKEKINGREYYIHTVEKGNSLYGIAKIYNVAIDEITKANPEIDTQIKPGQKIKIPIKTDAKTELNVIENNNTSNQTNTKLSEKKNTTTSEKYTIHIVEKGETLYGISKKYKVTVEQITELNPEAMQGISIGQELKIPQFNVLNNQTKTNEQLNTNTTLVFVEHRVAKGETLYAISRQYNTGIDSIFIYNEHLANGIKPEQTLVIPTQKALAEKNNLKYYPDKNSLVINTTAANTNKPIINREKKAVYEIGLLLPFYLDKNQQILEAKNNPNEKPALYEPTRQALDFYHGVLLALDSLKAAGLSVNLRVYETNRDSLKINNIINLTEFKNLDLIIGPIENIEQVAKKANEYKIPMVCPFAYSNKILLENPYVAKATTTISVMIEEASRYLVEKYKNENIIIIDGLGKNDATAIKAYKKCINENLKKAGIKDTAHYVKAESYASKTWSDKLQKDKINVLVVPNTEFSYVSSFLSNLNNISIKPQYKDYQYVVFGMDEWARWDDLDAYYKIKFQVHIPASVFIDFDDKEKTIPFIASFRNKYKCDPDKYAMMGFDITYYMMTGYLNMGKSFFESLENYKWQGVNTGFDFKKITSGSGYTNTHVYLLKYEDYMLKKQ